MPALDKDKPKTPTNPSGGTKPPATTPAPPRPTQTVATQPVSTRQGLSGQLAAAGLNFPFDVTKYIDDAIRFGGADPMNYAYARIIKSPEFRFHYQGIFDEKGVMRMSVPQYDTYWRLAQAEADKSGVKITRGDFGRRIVGQNKSFEELKFDLEAAQRIRTNQDVIASFNMQLRDAGLKPITTAQEAFNFMTMKSSRQSYELYEAAVIQGAAKGAGLDVSSARARELAGQPGMIDFDAAEEKFATIAAQAENLGDAALASWGLARKDLETVQFGGQGRTAIAAVLSRALAQEQANRAADVGGETMRIVQGRPVTGRPQEADAGIVPGTPFQMPPEDIPTGQGAFQPGKGVMGSP